MGGEASDIHENPFYKSSTYMQKLLNNIIMSGIKETYDNGCCLYTPSWLEQQTIKQLKEAGDRPLLLRTWKLMDLYQYLDFWTPQAPHLVTPAKKKKGVVAEPAGGFQYARERYTAEIGKISTNMVDFVMTKELKTKPPGKLPSTKLPPDEYNKQLAAFKAAEASFIKACQDFTRGGDAAAEPSVEAYFPYRRIPGNKSFIATEGAIEAMKSLLGVKAANPPRVCALPLMQRLHAPSHSCSGCMRPPTHAVAACALPLMQLALMDCKVLGRLNNSGLCRRAVGANQADEHQRHALRIFEDLLEEDCPEAPETPWEFNLPGLTIVCTPMCKGVITQMVQLGMKGELDGMDVSSKVLQRLGDDAGDGSFTKMALPAWFKHNRFQEAPQNAAALMEHRPGDLGEEDGSDDRLPAQKKARVATGLSSSDPDE
ncbi:hypothetical protein DUNSADRAFT_12466 [Dunaliella salina]|uniref:Uncharacterized protein n=1 Tax=Dunaliella salina TaxID=3046 RepID=A0ABQ7H3V1_DUNSA|nr:hypothetical protein DUNSADRAFT_12466 [Dunaliella salina]KAF5841537.1 hypothetical protein DUNSADRAFT_12466 [Dunaliella salina]KAF5841538.1 hypothetical protein DUNSADRAFT_12466 [Dunaliella salina]|eukprot:KAF5841536.1 hypothetical protein DUNSADRAFT_12466 [Dunaliella salina]